MKRKTILVLGFVLCFTLTSCVTARQNKLGEQMPQLSPICFENEDIVAELSFHDGEWINLELENKTNYVIQLITDLSTYTSISGKGSKLVPEGTKYADATNSIPSTTIAPKSKFQKKFFSADSIYFSSGKYGGWRMTRWLPDSLNGSSFVFTYKLDNTDKYIIFDGNDSKTLIPDAPTKIGVITSEKTFWHLLFLGDSDKNREELYALALEEAKKEYGDNIELYNLNYVGKWSLKSLLLWFSTLGYVENASLTADVYSE